MNKKTEAIKDWLLEVSEESDIDSDVITARSLLSRLEDTERLSIFDKTAGAGTARSHDQFLCRRVHGVSGHGRVP